MSDVKERLIRNSRDPGVAVVVGAILLAVILITIFSAYLLFYVPLTAETNSMNAITTEQNDLISLAQRLNNPPYTGFSISHSIQLGYAGVPPFSQATPSTVSFFDNSSYFKGYLNYSFNVTLANSTIVPPLSSGILGLLPITISSNISQSPSGFDQKIIVNSSEYQSYEAAGLTNILFMYKNGTIIPSWLENNNSNASSATTYWLKLFMPNTQETIYLVFLSPSINVMNSYQTGEAPSLSKPYGQYDDGSSVFPLYFNGNAPLSDFNVSSAYSVAHSNVYVGSNSIDVLNVSTNVKAAVYVPFVYNAGSVPEGSNWIEETSFGTGNLGGNSAILGLGTSPNQADYGNGSIGGVVGTSAIGMYAGSSSFYVTNEANGNIPLQGTSFGSINSSQAQSWLYGELDYTHASSATIDNFTAYSEQQLYAHNQTASYANPINSTSPSLYIAPIAYQKSNGATSSYYYYYNWIRVRTPPINNLMPTVTFGQTSTSAVPMLPITLSARNGTGQYVQPIWLNSSRYQNYESQNLSNVFFAYGSGDIIPSWLESGDSNTSHNTTYWLSLNLPPFLFNTTIYAVFLPKFMNFFNNFRTGEAPNLSSTYGQYDDGNAVFSYYNNGVSTPPLVNTGSNGTGPVVTPTAPSPWNYSLMGSVSGGNSTATSWTTAGLNSTSSIQLNLSQSYAVQAMVYLSGAQAEAGLLTNVQNISNGHFYVFGVNASSAGRDIIGYYPAGSSGPVTVASSGNVISDKWYQLTALNVNDNLSLYISEASTLSSYGSVEMTHNGTGYTGGGIAVSTLGSTSTDYWTRIIARALPSNDTFPIVSIGSIKPGLSSPNILSFSRNVQMNGTFSALTSFSSNGIGGIYLSNGAVILSSGKQSVVGGTLPINISTNSSGYGIALNAVSIQGNNVSASSYGASTITLANIKSYSVSYQRNQIVHFVSGMQIPYSAVVANISITKLNYTIVGNLGGAFNNTLYHKFGTGPAIGGNWSLVDGNLLAVSTYDYFSISMNATSLDLNSISVNYNSYILEDI